MSVKITIVSDQKNRISINSQNRNQVKTGSILPASDPRNRISINDQNRKQIKTVAVTPDISLVNSLASLNDVDASDPDNNETLVYDDTTGKYVVKTLPNINGGTF